MEFLRKLTVKLPLDDEKIVEMYFERDEKAIDETDYKYRKYLASIAYNILHDKLDSEECLNDTYLGAWNAMPPLRPNSLKAFLTTVIRRCAIKRYHSSLRKKAVPSEMTVSLNELGDVIADDADIGETLDAEMLAEIISEFIRSLPERRRFIFISRYYITNPIDMIASELRVSRSTVNKEIAAIRNALKKKLESEGYAL